MARKKISTTIYITEDQNSKLKDLHDSTRVPVAEYIRTGIDMVLAHYNKMQSSQTFFSSNTNTNANDESISDPNL